MTTKKIKDIINKLKKHLIFMFNPLVQNNKPARTTSILNNPFKLWFYILCTICQHRIVVKNFSNP
jgi:hypothetical protein